MLKGSSTCLYTCTHVLVLYEKNNRYLFSPRDVTDECFITARQLWNLSVRAIVPSRCKTSTLLYAGRKTLVFETAATSR
jgi:hypothetical protein